MGRLFTTLRLHMGLQAFGFKLALLGGRFQGLHCRFCGVCRALKSLSKGYLC